MNKNNLKWEDSYYFKNIISPLRNNLYPASPNPEQYGITITILEDYLKKKKALDEKFYCGEDGFKGMAFKYCLYFGGIICVILGLALGSVGGLFLGVGIVVALFYVACRVFNSKLEKARSAIELPAIEMFIKEYEQWRHDNNISAW